MVKRPVMKNEKNLPHMFFLISILCMPKKFTKLSYFHIFYKTTYEK